MFFSNTRKERGSQPAEHVSRRRPLHLFHRVLARLSLFSKSSSRGFSFHRCGELFLLYVTSQTTKSQMVPYHLLYPIRGRHEVVATVEVYPDSSWRYPTPCSLLAASQLLCPYFLVYETPVADPPYYLLYTVCKKPEIRYEDSGVSSGHVA